MEFPDAKLSASIMTCKNHEVTSLTVAAAAILWNSSASFDRKAEDCAALSLSPNNADALLHHLPTKQSYFIEIKCTFLLDGLTGRTRCQAS